VAPLSSAAILPEGDGATPVEVDLACHSGDEMDWESLSLDDKIDWAALVSDDDDDGAAPPSA
jgi:hypothetical protein